MASTASINCITVVKNSALARITHTTTPFSKTALCILAVLEREGLISGFRAKDRRIFVSMLNSDTARQRLREIEAISKPSKPIYVSFRTLTRIESFAGGSLDALVILNTTRGIVTMKDAIGFRVGGELLFSGSSLVTELMVHK